MKNEITLGQLLTIVIPLILTVIGWGVSVEIRLAVYKMTVEDVIEMKQKIDEMHTQIVLHEYKLQSDKQLFD